MTIEKIKLGKAGEELAAHFLEGEGYRIIEKNVRTPLGEIDIVAMKSDTVCFIEVKTRKTTTQGTPFEAITKAKQRKLSQLALSYLKRKKWMERRARFDIVAVMSGNESEKHLEILENAFDLNGKYSY